MRNSVHGFKAIARKDTHSCVEGNIIKSNREKEQGIRNPPSLKLSRIMKINFYLADMYRILALFVLLLQDPTHGVTVTGIRVTMVLDHTTTKDEITEYKAKLRDRNIDFKIMAYAFNKDKTLKYIKFYINCKDGFMSGIEKQMDSTSCILFYRDYTPQGTDPFRLEERVISK